MNNMQRQFMEAIALFGLTPNNFNFNGISFEEANRRIAEIKIDAKKKYKELAKVNHPDVGGSKEDFQKLQSAYEIIQKLRVQIIQPQPVVRYYYHTGFAGGTSSTTTNAWY